MRVVHRDDARDPADEQSGYLIVQPAREHVARDLAADVVRLLSSGAELERRSRDGTLVGEGADLPGGHRRARPRATPTPS